MSKLWEPVEDYKRFNPQSLDDLREANLYPARFLPYKRLYKNLTPVKLRKLLADAKRLRWEALDLSRCGLNSLPDELWELEDLRVLVLGNVVTTRAEDGNTFEAVPPGIGQLTNLQSLNLGVTEIRALPDSIGQLTNLQSLYLSNTQISVLPDCITKLTNLQSLDLFGTPIRALPDCIGQLTNLQSLDLSHTQIRALPDCIGELTNLQSLDLYSTPIRALPDSIVQLTNLQSLNLGDTPIRALPDSIVQLTNLQLLDLFNTPIRALPDSIGQLKNLKTLDLESCRLQEIPYSVVELGLPFMTDTMGIDLRYKPRGVILRGVTLDEGDITIFDQSRDVIEAYYQGKQSQIIRECKVIFLGDGAVGKSSLIQRMVERIFDEKKLPTDGVNTTRWHMEVQGDDYTLRILDFGGQEIMHSMHRCFLTAHTVYVVVCESRDDVKIDAVASRWLDTVRSFAPDCPVILALNKADLNSNVSVNERTLRERNPDLKTVLKTSAAVKPETKFGVNHLVEAIREEIPGAVHAYRANADIIALKEALENMTEDTISAEDYKKLCVEHHITDGNLQYNLLGYFRDLGVAYYYESKSYDTNVSLNSVRVLNPEWLTNGIYRLILRTKESGFLNHEDIEDTLSVQHAGDISKITYTPEETEYILHVMRYYEISLSIRDHQGRETGVEMIPLKLPKTPPKVQEDGREAFADEFPEADALHLRWEGTYLPNNLIHRLLIRKFPELDTRRVWRTGGRFHQRGGDCEAMAEMNDNALDVYVIGEQDRRPYLDTFRVEILDILQKLNVSLTEKVCVVAANKTGYISYASLLKLYRDSIKSVLIELKSPGNPNDSDGLMIYVNPAELLEGTYVKLEENPQQIGKETAYMKVNQNRGSVSGDNSVSINVTGSNARITFAPPPAASEGKDNTDKDDSLDRELTSAQIKQAKVETTKNRLLLTGGVTLALAYGAYLLIQAIFQPGTPLEFNPFEFLAQLLSG